MTTYVYLTTLLSAWFLQPVPMAICVVIVALFLLLLVQNYIVVRRLHKRMENITFTGKMVEQALKISANNVVRYNLSDNYIYRLYGSLYPEEGISLADWKKHVHPDDFEETLQYFRDMIDGKIERAEFYYRWNFDFSGGTPRWGYLHDASVVEYLPKTNRVVNIISTLRDETDLHREELEESELTDKYKLIFEHSIIGLSFYSADGWLLDANAIMRDICHFDSETTDAYFSNINLFDASPFNECVNRDNVEELWICSQSIVPERNMHDYLEIHLHPIRDDVGTLKYIAVAVRNVTGERQMYLQAKLNDLQIQKVNQEIMRYEEELRYMMEACDMRAWRLSFSERKIRFYKGLGTLERELTIEETEKYFINIPEIVRLGFKDPYKYFAQPMSYAAEMLPLFHESEQSGWNQVNSIPVRDDNGEVVGCFGLVRNITGMMRKQEQLKKETERANDSGRQKSVFLANMTHEIRTPLNAIVGFTDLLQAIDSPDDKREMIRVIHNNCDMLLRLVNDILVLSSADANAMEIIPENIDFAADFDLSCVSLAERVQEPTVEFIKDNPYETLRTRLDNSRINQVITNFVTNAVKYTHQGYIRVGIHLEERDGKEGIYCYCEDTGSGIPKDKQGPIFERFVKLNDYIQGTGLGLSICKAIVEKCGGEIGVDSEVGKGSTFWFWIPANIEEVKEKQLPS